VELGATLKAFLRLPGVSAPGFCPSFIYPATPGFSSSCCRFQLRNFLQPCLTQNYFFGIRFNGRRTFDNLRGDIIRVCKLGFEEADVVSATFRLQ
jgi:hypothetical protein